MCVLCIFIMYIYTMLESDWLTNVLRCAIIFRETHGERSSRQFLTALHVHITSPNEFCYFKREREVVCGKVWWPILGICALHLTHPSAHTQQWTHTRSSGQPMGSSWGFGALLKGLTSVVVLVIHSPHLQSLPDLRLEPTTFGLQVRLSIH